MTDALDVTAPTARLADAATRISRLLPARSLQHAHAGLLLRADGDGLLLIAHEDGLAVQIRIPATTHDHGEVMVSRRGLTDTVTAVAAPEMRLTAEGHRLAIHMPGARFALPVLGAGQLPPPGLPRAVGTLSGAELCAAVVPVAGAASRDHALQILTGVRLRTHGDRISVSATDRYRLAAASLPWQRLDVDSTADMVERAPTVDTLVPAAFLSEAGKQADRAEHVVVHSDDDLFGLAWDGGSIVTSTLSGAFPDAQLDRLLDVNAECVIEVEADALAGAVERASRYADGHGRVAIAAVDGALLVRASDPLNGESEEAVKASVQGGPVTRFYQARLLSGALRAAAHQTAVIRIQDGMRATEFAATAGPAAAVELRYLVVPLKPGS